MHDVSEISEEHKLLLRDLGQAAKTLLDVGAGMPYALAMFRLSIQREALSRTNDNRSRAAELLGMHRNTFTRNLPPEDRKAEERYTKKRPPRRAVRIYKYPALPGIQTQRRNLFL